MGFDCLFGLVRVFSFVFVLFLFSLSSVISEKKIAELFKLNVYLCVGFGFPFFLIHWYFFQMFWVQKKIYYILALTC